MIFYTTPGREPSEVVGKAFTKGSGGKYMETCIFHSGPSAFYGTSKYTKPVLDKCRREGYDYYYIDNGYFFPSNHREGDYSGYYKVTKNAEQHSGSGLAMCDRWRVLDIKISDWDSSPNRSNILLVCQSRWYFDAREINLGKVMYNAIIDISQYSDRPIVIRPKPTRFTKTRDLQADLDKAWCVVTYSSNVAVTAAIQGIPVITLGACAANPISNKMEDIEKPKFFDIEQWAYNLAANQWTIEEMENGTCWNEVK